MKLFLSIVLVFCIAGTIVASGVAYYVFNMVDSSSGIELEHLSLNETSIIYANDTQTQEPVEVTRLHGSENRIWVDLDQIPKYLSLIHIYNNTWRIQRKFISIFFAIIINTAHTFTRRHAIFIRIIRIIIQLKTIKCTKLHRSKACLL